METDKVDDSAYVCHDVQGLARFYRQQLLENVLPFWLQHGLDRQVGGMMTCLDRTGQVIDTDKGIWQQGRAAWMFARTYNSIESRPEYLEAAILVGEFLKRHGTDASDGRMWFHVTREGRPIRKRRYAFSEAFAAIAFGELAQATGDSEYTLLAERCFEQYMLRTQQPPPTKSIG